MRLLILVIIQILVVHAMAGDQSLESQLGALDMSEAAIPQSVAKEKFYTIQPRPIPLKYRTELGIGYGSNLSGNSFLATEQLTGSLQFHFNDRWSLAAAKSQVYNKFTSAANQLAQNDGMIPDVAYATDRTEATVEYNVFYGKFRFTREQTLYFDYFVGAGMGKNNLKTETVDGYVANTGLVFWFPKASFRIGFKDYYYQEKRLVSSDAYHNVHAYSSVNYLF